MQLKMMQEKADIRHKGNSTPGKARGGLKKATKWETAKSSAISKNLVLEKRQLKSQPRKMDPIKSLSIIQKKGKIDFVTGKVNEEQNPKTK